jgi:hypothetical protein
VVFIAAINEFPFQKRHIAAFHFGAKPHWQINLSKRHIGERAHSRDLPVLTFAEYMMLIAIVIILII